ncbi:hypothetical protein, partial [Brunnivagina elsteri]|uniref:hypothetical protein n=1 Tax=Brunnivagina elsteri TaxID=1247191 RepID=UPI001B80D606
MASPKNLRSHLNYISLSSFFPWRSWRTWRFISLSIFSHWCLIYNLIKRKRGFFTTHKYFIL